MNNFNENKKTLKKLICPLVLATTITTSALGLVGCGKSYSNSEERISEYIEEDIKSTFYIYKLNDNTAIIFDAAQNLEGSFFKLMYYNKDKLIEAIGTRSNNVDAVYDITYLETIEIAKDMLGEDGIVMYAGEYFEQLGERKEENNVKKRQLTKN